MAVVIKPAAMLVQPFRYAPDVNGIEIVIEKEGATPASFSLTRTDALNLANLIHEALNEGE